jgi:hypothetical protein
MDQTFLPMKEQEIYIVTRESENEIGKLCTAGCCHGAVPGNL